MKAPLSLVKEKFGDKTKLVEAVKAFVRDDLWLPHANAGKGLEHVSNAKLLRLHQIFTNVTEKFGTRAKLVDEVLKLMGHPKDENRRSLLSAWPVPRLVDQYNSLTKRIAKAAEKKAPEKVANDAPAKKARVKKAPAKKAAAKKAPAKA